MADKKRILAICGSTKPDSVNKRLIQAIAALTADYFEVTVFEDIAGIPHFNPVLDNDTPPASVVHFRGLLQEAQGILICTPEYAMGVPGTLKNAIDWIVSSCSFCYKPTALITASTHGLKGHQALLETLRVIESDITDDTHMVISYVRTKVNNEAMITDAETQDKVVSVLLALKALIENKEAQAAAV